MYFIFSSFELRWAKSLILLPPSPPRFLGVFGDFPPKNPQNLRFPRPQSIPETIKSFVPVPVPKKRGFLGIYPKFPRNLSCPHPQSFPVFLIKYIPVPVPIPVFWGIPENPRKSPKCLGAIYLSSSPFSGKNPKITKICNKTKDWALDHEHELSVF